MPAVRLPAIRRAVGDRVTTVGWIARVGPGIAWWLLSILMVGVGRSSAAQAGYALPIWTAVLDVALGALVGGLTCLRRRWPLAITLAAALISGYASTSFGFLTWILISFGTRRRWRHVPLVLVSHMLAVTVSIFAPLTRIPAEVTDAQRIVGWVFAYGFTLAWDIACIAMGFYVGARRELILTLTDRAETAEREQALRIAQGQAAERARIAREMHDVVAHRISLVSMHAGVLAYRDDLSREQTKEIAHTIEDNSRAALTELRAVLGSLRDEDPQPSAPQPTLLDIDQLIAESRAAGMDVTLDDRLGPLHLEVPAGTGRHAYRIVQEALTNARKHAADSPVTVTLAGTRGEVRIEVRNPLGRETGVPGAGMGLVGIAERARLAGGTLEAGRVWGDFVVEAWLPWTT